MVTILKGLTCYFDKHIALELTFKKFPSLLLDEEINAWAKIIHKWAIQHVGYSRDKTNAPLVANDRDSNSIKWPLFRCQDDTDRCCHMNW